MKNLQSYFGQTKNVQDPVLSVFWKDFQCEYFTSMTSESDWRETDSGRIAKAHGGKGGIDAFAAGTDLLGRNVVIRAHILDNTAYQNAFTKYPTDYRQGGTVSFNLYNKDSWSDDGVIFTMHQNGKIELYSGWQHDFGIAISWKNSKTIPVIKFKILSDEFMYKYKSTLPFGEILSRINEKYMLKVITDYYPNLPASAEIVFSNGNTTENPDTRPRRYLTDIPAAKMPQEIEKVISEYYKKRFSFGNKFKQILFSKQKNLLKK